MNPNPFFSAIAFMLEESRWGFIFLPSTSGSEGKKSKVTFLSITVTSKPQAALDRFRAQPNPANPEPIITTFVFAVCFI
jgi:hypothetical protein